MRGNWGSERAEWAIGGGRKTGRCDWEWHGTRLICHDPITAEKKKNQVKQKGSLLANNEYCVMQGDKIKNSPHLGNEIENKDRTHSTKHAELI